MADPFSLNLRHLRALVAVSESGGIGTAARMVNLTQPAVTQAIAKLEKALGVRLFERDGAGTRSTEAAERFCARIRTAMRLIGSNRTTTAQMRAFIALARAGSYSGAAKSTGLSEPTLHRTVGDLALGMGEQLVVRRGKGVTLTTRGRAIARNLNLARLELESGLAEIAELEGREVGRIAIGAMSLSRARLLPAAILAFNARFPGVDVAVIEGSHSELSGPLRNGDIDIMIGALRPAAAVKDLTQIPLFVDRPVVVGKASHALPSRDGPLNEAELVQYPWILPSIDTPLRIMWEAMFKEAGLASPRVAIECGSVAAIRHMLMHSDALTLLSPEQVAAEMAAGWLRRIADAPRSIARTIGITSRPEWRPTLLQQRFLDHVMHEGSIFGDA